MMLAQWYLKLFLLFVTFLLSSSLFLHKEETFLEHPEYHPPERPAPRQTKDGGTRS